MTSISEDAFVSFAKLTSVTFFGDVGEIGYEASPLVVILPA